MQFGKHIGVAEFRVIGIKVSMLRHERYGIIGSEFMDALTMEKDVKLVRRREFEKLNCTVLVKVNSEAVHEPFAGVVHGFGWTKGCMNISESHSESNRADTFKWRDFKFFHGRSHNG